jgi:transposase InsO family protein
MLDREGIRDEPQRNCGLYAEEQLQVRRREGRKRVLGTRAPMARPQGPDHHWSMDFVSDTLTDGRRSRILAVMDDVGCECLCLVADTSLSGVRVVSELDAIIAWRGRPLLCVSDNGTELTSTASAFEKTAGTEKQPSTEQRNTATMGVAARRFGPFSWYDRRKYGDLSAKCFGKRFKVQLFLLL